MIHVHAVCQLSVFTLVNFLPGKPYQALKRGQLLVAKRASKSCFKYYIMEECLCAACPKMMTYLLQCTKCSSTNLYNPRKILTSQLSGLFAVQYSNQAPAHAGQTGSKRSKSDKENLVTWVRNEGFTVYILFNSQILFECINLSRISLADGL